MTEEAFQQLKQNIEDARKRKANRDRDTQPRPLSIIQKLKDDLRPETGQAGAVEGKAIPHHSAEEKALDGRGHPQYRITITHYVSDRRMRDGDGMDSTVLDSLITAARRLAGVDTRTKQQSSVDEQRERTNRD